MKDPRFCLYSGIFMMGRTSVDEDIPTACTDGYNTMYGRKFMDKLIEQETRALVLHENLHKAFRHTTVWEPLYKEWPQLANMACDYVINLLIHDADPQGTHVKLPESGLLDPKYRGMDAGTVFRDLKKQAESKKSIHVKTVGDQKGKDIPVVDGGCEGVELDEHDWKNAKEMSREEKEKIAKEVDQALRQGAILAGKMGANVPREIGELMESKIDWREALREFITSFCADKDDSTWRRPNRRWIGQDVYMPSLIGEAVGRILIGIDMSGSIGPNEISQFLGEVKNICDVVKPEAIELVYWDTSVCAHETYTQDQLEMLVSSTKPRGGGGTDVRCVPEYMKKHKMKVECAIILTDGYLGGDWGDWDCPTLWGITTDVQSPIGKSMRVS
jgi:predicted metal-dependent peptidase